jgi:Mrp family chromosome partitioning ATPase/predicted Fe-Mo cluster-binding NifX family protein
MHDNQTGRTSCDVGSRSSQQRAPGQSLEAFLERQKLTANLSGVAHKLLVLSGKGGVGKSTVAANLAAALSAGGCRVGLLDVDFHGPSIPRLTGIAGQRPRSCGDQSMLPPQTRDGVKVMSIGLLLGGGDSAVIWRGPMKMNVIKQLLRDVRWGQLDCLVVDSPPGTGDEPLSVAQLIPGVDGAVLVTTPQALSADDVRRSVDFCRKLELPVLGIVENMSGFCCPHCGKESHPFKTGGGQALAEETGVPFLGRIPVDPRVVTASDQGRAFCTEHPDSPASGAFQAAIEPIRSLVGTGRSSKGVRKMRIAIPVAEGSLAMHFGHCQEFALFDVDEQTREAGEPRYLTPPSHAPGALPRWLAENGAQVIIAGGMGSRAQDLFAQSGIRVVVGAPSQPPEKIVGAYLAGELETGGNICDH